MLVVPDKLLMNMDVFLCVLAVGRLSLAGPNVYEHPLGAVEFSHQPKRVYFVTLFNVNAIQVSWQPRI